MIKKISISVAMIYIIAGSALGQYTTTGYRLKGKVARLETKMYTQTKQGEKHLVNETIITFDTLGRITAKQDIKQNLYYQYKYRTNSTLLTPDSIVIKSGNENESVIAISYTASGEKTSEIQISDNVAIKRTDISYDSTTNTKTETIIQLPSNTPTQQIISVYDQDGCKIKECFYVYDNDNYNHPRITHSIASVYDIESNLMQTITYSYNDEGVVSRCVDTYNKRGKVETRNCYTEDDFLFQSQTSKYDKHNNLKKNTTTYNSEDESITNTTTSKYQYDHYGNWIELKFIQYTTERNIIYYE